MYIERERDSMMFVCCPASLPTHYSLCPEVGPSLNTLSHAPTLCPAHWDPARSYRYYDVYTVCFMYNAKCAPLCVCTPLQHPDTRHNAMIIIPVAYSNCQGAKECSRRKGRIFGTRTVQNDVLSHGTIRTKHRM